MSQQPSNVDQHELDKFTAMAASWWDLEGEFRPLHRINPLRLDYLQSQTGTLADKQVLDIGCGGGIFAESIARQGATVTGIDMAQEPLEVARLHAQEQGITIDYRACTAEQMAAEHPASFDVVTCMEMLEHVPDPSAIIVACAQLVKPGGTVLLSTINKTLKARILAVTVAERVLRWLPVGTHDADKFIRPSVLMGWCDHAGLIADDCAGITYNPLFDRFRLSKNIDINYMVACHKPVEG